MLLILPDDAALLMCEREKLCGIVSPSLLKPYVTLHELEQGCSTPDLQDVLGHVVDQCIRYALSVGTHLKVLTSGVGGQDLLDAEESRSRIHNATIDAINALSRQLKRAGKNNAWIWILSTQGRVAYCKFAILLAFEAIEQSLTPKEVPYG